MRKSQILEIAEALARQQGAARGFSYRNIAEHVDVRAATIHHHFPKKDDLLAELFAKCLDDFHRWAEDLETSEPRDKVAAFFRRYAELSGGLCMVGVIGAGLEAFGPGATAAAKEYVRGTLEWLEHVLEQGLRKGQLSFRRDARSEALRVYSTLAGGLQLTRVLEAEGFDSILQVLTADLGLPDPEKRTRQGLTRRPT